MPSPARPRHVAFSAKQKKEQLKAKRAVKRGELDPSAIPDSNGRTKIVKTHKARSVESGGLALHSRFLAVPHDYAVPTRDAAWDDELPRPLNDVDAVFPLHLVENSAVSPLTVPSRPAFVPGQTKAEVERNEEVMFRKWMATARNVVGTWIDGDEDPDANGFSETPTYPEPSKSVIRSPSSFETNLEVWRQLWRVVEASHIVLLLVDARCPPVHCPPSLRAYLRDYTPKRGIIIVLTKSDLVDPAALEGWKAWLKNWWNEGKPTADPINVVAVSSYDTELLYADGRHRPLIPTAARAELIAALRTAHGRLSNNTSPTVRSTVRWAELERLDAEVHHEEVEETSAVSNTNSPSAPDGATDTVPTRDPETEPLTIGLVGQPNVGKSSLLNALLGAMRVRASATPGKTKHWQTILWGAQREVRIVDCPGLVCPSLVPMELQAMAGILPIAQIPSLPACISFAARYMPLERIFRLPPPEPVEDAMAAKRTWRKGMEVKAEPPKGPRWTAGEIMDRRALDRGFITAKSGRPDCNRSADGMMRALADGRVRWGFWPPGTSPERSGEGVFLGEWQGDDISTGESGDSESDGLAMVEIKEVESGGSDNEDDDFVNTNNASFFAALSINETEEED